MDATNFLSSNTTFLQQPAGVSYLFSKKLYILSMAGSRRSKGRDYEGRLVNENRIALRMRIKEKKLLEANYEPPSNWMEWEKKYYVRYNEDICEAMGLFQNYLMNIRPGFALGIIGVLALSVAISTGFLFYQSIVITKIIFSGFHLL
ncbi:uncharacterized protein LOC123197484 [Mangifera indica]|uniref:uncharacterized protein LOC123197484 n=1 Tax=Mangifera indica TaxID=29780 RepID=UPI001CFB0B5A|nr:uncharacterized protein LOC123197484 [Mangifera indica]